MRHGDILRARDASSPTAHGAAHDVLRVAARGTHYSRFGPFLDKKIRFTYLNRSFITRIALFRYPQPMGTLDLAWDAQPRT